MLADGQPESAGAIIAAMLVQKAARKVAERDSRNNVRRAAKAAVALAAASAAAFVPGESPTPLSVFTRRVLQTHWQSLWRSNASRIILQSQFGTHYGAQRLGDSTDVEVLAVGPSGGSLVDLSW